MSNIPFNSLKKEGWQNLGLLALAMFYFVYIGMDLAWKNTCGQLAIDYCSFWSAAQIANQDGYSEMYNLEKMEFIQRSIAPERESAREAFATSPTVYLPIFILPFQLLSPFGPYIGFWLWNGINLLLFIYYFQFFTKEVSGRKLNNRLLIMLLLSLPVFLNLFVGQVNIWLAICVGEFIRMGLNKKPFIAGLWLGGILLKPQFLILIGLALLIRRSIISLLGLLTSTFAIISTSYFMIGNKGILSLMGLWLGFAGGIPTNDVEIMMNWRMIGLNLSMFLGNTPSWVIASAGMLLTFAIFLYIWLYPTIPTSSTFVMSLLGTLAATNIIAWHSHVHSAVILIPPILYIYCNKMGITEKSLVAWIFIPPIFRVFVLAMATLIHINMLHISLMYTLNFLTSISMFILNINILVWVVSQKRRQAYSLV